MILEVCDEKNIGARPMDAHAEGRADLPYQLIRVGMRSYLPSGHIHGVDEASVVCKASCEGLLPVAAIGVAGGQEKLPRSKGHEVHYMLDYLFGLLVFREKVVPCSYAEVPEFGFVAVD